MCARACERASTPLAGVAGCGHNAVAALRLRCPLLQLAFAWGTGRNCRAADTASSPAAAAGILPPLRDTGRGRQYAGSDSYWLHARQAVPCRRTPA
eukprot:396727-Alexandrium_andersonii.AAC.1